MAVAGFIFDKNIMYRNLWSVIKNALGIIIGNKDIEGADRIVYETGIYKAVVISAMASKYFYFFLNIEVERLS